MEEQASAASTPPLTNPRDTPAAQPTPTPHPLLSTSEPFLRFPRPQGNRRLANWISASDPDIMRLTTATEDTGLAESTYELITGTDSDGNYAESMGDSVDSLDPHRPDDVHSLDGTEYTHDAESLADDVDLLPRTLSYEAVDEADQDQTEHINLGPNDDTLVAQDNRPDGSETKDSFSRSSLEYTHHSLGTPSILTPDVSKFVGDSYGDSDIPQQLLAHKVDGSTAHPVYGLAFIRQTAACIQGYVMAAKRERFTLLLITAALIFFTSVLDHRITESPRPEPSVVFFTVTTTTTSMIVSTATPSKPRPCPPSTGRMDLIPLGDGTSDEWIFGARKPSISFHPHAQTDILVHVPGHAKQAWLAGDCLAFKAIRGDRQIKVHSSSVDEGILLKFPKKEAHGVVNLSLEATCRPRIQRLVRVQFGKGIMEEALEMTRSLAHNLSGLVPAAALEAERCFEGARRSLGAVSDSVVFVSDDLLGRVGKALSRVHQSLAGAKAKAQSCIGGVTDDFANKLGTASQHAKEELNHVQDVQTQLQLGLLDARISAKLWWLSATRRKAERDEYKRKAENFVCKKLAVAKKASRARRGYAKAEETGSRRRAKMPHQGRFQRWCGRHVQC